MKFLSSISAAALLAVSAAGIVAAPAAHAAKEQKADAPKLKLSKAFEKSYGDGVNAYNAGDAAAMATALTAMEAAASTPEDQHMLAQFKFSMGDKIQDSTLKLAGLEALLASPLKDPKLVPAYHSEIGLIYFNKIKDFPKAAQAFDASYKSGAAVSGTAYNAAMAYGNAGQFVPAIDWMITAMDAERTEGKPVNTGMLKRLAFYANQTRDVAQIDRAYGAVLKHSDNSAYWHDALALTDAGIQFSDHQRLDLYRLMRDTDAFKQKQEVSSYLATAKRFPAEQISVIDQAASKGLLSKSETTFAEAYNTAQRDVVSHRQAWNSDEKQALASARGYDAQLTGDSLFSAGEFARAAKMYETALQKGGLTDSEGMDQTDRARIRLAQAQYHLGNYSAALATLDKLTDANWKKIGKWWKLRIEKKSAAGAAS